MCTLVGSTNLHDDGEIPPEIPWKNMRKILAIAKQSHPRGESESSLIAFIFFLSILCPFSIFDLV